MLNESQKKSQDSCQSLKHTLSYLSVKKSAGIAQSVEQRIENPRVPGSSPGPGIQNTNMGKSLAFNCAIISVSALSWSETPIAGQHLRIAARSASLSVLQLDLEVS
jgi:hypothetical protein